MRLFLWLLICTLVCNTTTSQVTQHIMLESNMVEIEGHYSFKGYKHPVSTLLNSNLAYLRAITKSGDWLIGGSLGYQKISINEQSLLTSEDQNITAIKITPAIMIRNENFWTRRSKGFVEAGFGYNFPGGIRTNSYNGQTVVGNKLKRSPSAYFSYGYRYLLTQTWCIEFGARYYGDITASMLLNNRLVKISTASITFTAVYSM